MKQVTLMRHAKAHPGERGMRDIDRPLNEYGRLSSIRMGAFMASRSLFPDIALCSPALRTRETLTGFIEGLNNNQPERMLVDSLYNGPADIIRTEISMVDDRRNHVLVVGHNPGLHSLTINLAAPDGSRTSLLDAVANKFPPGSIAHLRFNVTAWELLRTQRGELLEFTFPKALGIT